jgi:disulfide bond formation protein DsbB
MTGENNKQIPDRTGPKQRAISEDGIVWMCLFLAWAVALAATLGALFIGEVMGQTPCIMCWYQRAFMFPLAVILGVAAFRCDPTVWRYALPLTGFGALIALYHSLLYGGLITEALAPCRQGASCTSADMTVFGQLPLPMLSLGSFLGIAILTLIAQRRTRT